MKRRDFLKAAALGAPALAPLIHAAGASLTPSWSSLRESESTGLAASSLLAQSDSSGGMQDVTPEQARAIDRGLDWLAKHQLNSGAIGATCQVAFTSLAGLAFMAGNSTPHRGKYARNVRDCLRFILRCCDRKSGYIGETFGRGMGGSGMHGHGYATWFLAELYGMSGDGADLGNENVKERLQQAIKCIEYSQDGTGGWTYEPSPNGNEGSVTVAQVQALRSARNAGLTVNKQTIEQGIDYIKKSTYEDGTIAYSLGSRGHMGGTYALTSAGMCVYSLYGQYDAPELKKGMEAVMDFLLGRRHRGGNHEFYAHLYAGQACFFSKRKNAEYWTRGYATIRSELLSMQDKNGSWSTDSYGGAFGTACAALVLQIPYRYLPIFQD